jgi:hypothetical protein
MKQRTLAARLLAPVAAVSLCGATGAAAATYSLGYPDVVLEFYDSGVGPIAGPYGGPTFASAGPQPVSTGVILGFDDVTFNGFVSLPTGSYITLGFTDEIITNGPGDDIFISEIGPANEEADIYVSTDYTTFTHLGRATNASFRPNIRLSFDLGKIGYGPSDVVRAIRVVGLDNFGASPGFDLNAVQIAFTSLTPGAPTAPGGVPEPATWAILLLGFGIVGAALRRGAAARA